MMRASIDALPVMSFRPSAAVMVDGYGITFPPAMPFELAKRLAMLFAASGDLANALGAVLPLAENRAEDMSASDEANKEDGIAYDASLTAAAWEAVNSAKALLASLNMEKEQS